MESIAAAAPAPAQEPRVGLLEAVTRFEFTSPRRTIVSLAVLAACAAVALPVWRCASFTATLLAYPYEWDEDEGAPIHFAAQLVNGGPIYKDFNRLPMVSACYPPVYYVATAAAVKAWGARLVCGRLVSAAAMLGTALLALIVVRQETRRWSYGLLAGALLLGGPYYTIYGPAARVDALAVFLAMAGLAAAGQYPRAGAAPASIALLLLATFTKYQMVFLAPAALWFLWRQNRRAGWIGAGAFAAAGLLIAAALQAWSGGHYWASTVSMHATAYGLDLLAARNREFLEQHMAVLLGAAGWLMLDLRGRQIGLWGAAFAASLPIVLLTGKEGAAINYFLPTVATGVVAAALAAERLIRTSPPAWRSGAAGAVLLAAAAQGLVWLKPMPRPTAADRAAGDRIVRMIREAPGETVTTRRLMLSVLAGRTPQTDACPLMFAYGIGRRPGSAEPSGDRPILWDPKELVQAIRDKRFPLLVVEPRYFPQEVLDAIGAAYAPIEPEPIRMGNWHGDNRYLLLAPQ